MAHVLNCRGMVIAGLIAALVLTACDDDSTSDDTSGPAPTRPTPTSGKTVEPPPKGPQLRQVDLELHEIAAGLSSPLLVTHAGDGSGRLFVVEQEGRILDGDGDGDAFEGRVFLDISSSITAGGEQGLLGLAFHRSFEDNGRLFVNYTDTQGDTVVAEYRAPGPSHDRADPESARVLLTFDQPFANHNGGGLAFGPDGYLYIGTGDGGSGGDPLNSGQSLDTFLGKLLRIDVAGGAGLRNYRIPPDNPFVGRDDARPEIWAYGLRNPWRFSFDPETSSLWVGDVGQNEFEEINRAPDGEDGIDYGWNDLEGPECFDPPEGCDRKGTHLPLAVYDHNLGCSVTGGYVYRGERFPDMAGAYFFGDYCSGLLWAVDATGPGSQEPVLLLESELSISSFGLDEDGELYVTDLSSGTVFRLEDASG